MKAILTFLLVLVTSHSVWSQSGIALNTSQNTTYLTAPAVPVKNLPAYKNITAFVLNPAIRNNQIEIGDTLIFDFENFNNIPGVVTYKDTDINNVTSYIVKFKEFQFAQAFISVNNKEYLIAIDIPEQNRKLNTYVATDRLTYYLVELDTANLDVLPCNDDLIKGIPDAIEKKKLPQGGAPAPTQQAPIKQIPTNTPATSQLQSKNSTGCDSLDEDDQAAMRVLIVYTQAALNHAGSQAAMDNLIAQNMVRANNASINSNLGITFSLAHAELTTYVEAGSGTDLNRLRLQADGFMDNVHALRNTFSADFVHLFSFTNDTGGLGYLLDTQVGRQDLAFALSRVQQISFTDTFIHELGHNMSASHASGQSVQPGPTNWTDWPGNNWTAGWRFQGTNNVYYTTLMAYNAGSSWPDGIGSTNISYFSTPLINFQGQPVGDAVAGDNSRSLKRMKHIISKYRDELTSQYCVASGSNPSTSNLFISNLSLNGLTNPTSWSSFNDFSHLRTCLTVGQTYPLTIDVAGGFGGAKMWVWVDWNNDLDFDDAGELVLSSPTGSTLQYNTTITPPLTAFIGAVRMRVRYEALTGTFSSAPCGTSSFGEVEDYTIVVKPGTVDTDGDGVPDDVDLDSDNDGILNVNEFNAVGTVNLALTGAASQSSTASGGAASRAIDGNTDGVYNNNSVTHTSNVLPTEFWDLDLNQTEPIAQVVFNNRTDCCSSRISNVYLLVANTPFPINASDLNGSLANADFIYQFATNEAAATITIPVRTIGRYIRLQKSGANIDNTLSIAELQVYAQAASDSDGDNIPDYLDLDSDNDGIPDNVEAQATAIYIPPATNNAATYLANNGVNTVYVTNPIIPVDSDGDGIPDYIDTDSDNDGLTDLQESFNPIPTGSVGTNGLLAGAEQNDDYNDVNGLAFNGTTFTLLDSDNDVPNGADYDYRDIPQTATYMGTTIITSIQNTNVAPPKVNAYLNVVANNLGVLITRVAGSSSIVNPVEGMLIYDTLDQTFKVNTTGTAAGWRPLGNF